MGGGGTPLDMFGQFQAQFRLLLLCTAVAQLITRIAKLVGVNFQCVLVLVYATEEDRSAQSQKTENFRQLKKQEREEAVVCDLPFFEEMFGWEFREHSFRFVVDGPYYQR